MLTGRAARGSTWRVLDEWVGQWSTTNDAAPTVRKAATRKPAKKPAAKSAAPKTPSPDPDAIGVNPTRRYGSASSRSLAR